MNPDTVVGYSLAVVMLLWLAEYALIDIAYRRWQHNHPPQVTELGALLDQEHRNVLAGRKP